MCSLCHRESRQSVKLASDGNGARWVLMALGFVLAGLFGVAAVRRSDAFSMREAPRAAVAVVTPTAASEIEVAPAASVIDAPQLAPPATTPMPQPGGNDARVASGLSTGGFGSSAPSANRASATAIPQAPNQADLQRVVSSIPIALYEANWCPHCRRAKAWFGAQRLNVTDYDVDHDAQAKQALVRYNPRGSLPTIVVGDRVLVGFSEDAVTRTLAAIASQKVGARVTARVSEPGH
jgi:glutaredoxin 3